MRPELGGLASLALRDHGLDISIYDDSFLERSVERRSGGGQQPADYLRRLETDRAEAEAFFASLRIGFSEFFRDPLAFACLERMVLPAIHQKKKQGREKEIRIWSAACAGGQESYSISMLCEELLARDDSGIACRIFASDMDEALLGLARRGVYESSCMGKLSLERLGTFFTRRADAWEIDPRLAERIEFSRFDLLAEAGSCPSGSIYGSFDLVFCSNLLFYYRSDAQDRILEKMEACLAPGGYLVTGEAERDIVARRRFREVFPASAIFQSCA